MYSRLSHTHKLGVAPTGRCMYSRLSSMHKLGVAPTVTSSPSGTLNLSPPDAINIAHDPMQNPRIFYKAGQTRMTLPGFNPGCSPCAKCAKTY